MSGDKKTPILRLVRTSGTGHTHTIRYGGDTIRDMADRLNTAGEGCGAIARYTAEPSALTSDAVDSLIKRYWREETRDEIEAVLRSYVTPTHSESAEVSSELAIRAHAHNYHLNGGDCPGLKSGYVCVHSTHFDIVWCMKTGLLAIVLALDLEPIRVFVPSGV